MTSDVVDSISPRAVVAASARQAATVVALAVVMTVVFGDDTPDVTGADALLTEASDTLTTEAGDVLITEA